MRGIIQLGELEFTHTFVVVSKLVAPVILGVDFLHANGLVLDFIQIPVCIRQANIRLVTPLRDSVILPLHSYTGKPSQGATSMHSCTVPQGG